MNMNKKVPGGKHQVSEGKKTSSQPVSSAPRPVPITKADSPKLFDAIARRYDLLNCILSVGMDIGWRRKLEQFLPDGDDLRILDLATGTADVAIALAKHNRGVREVVGVDLADEMINVGRAKIALRNLADRVRIEKADALALPFKSGTFDAVTVAFGLRNMSDLMRAFIEIRRVLAPKGRLIILEFSRPTNILIRPLHSFYLLWFVPVIGYLLTGNKQAYCYLSRTVHDFPYGERFQKIIQQVGFMNVRRIELALGTATIYVAEPSSFKKEGATV